MNVLSNHALQRTKIALWPHRARAYVGAGLDGMGIVPAAELDR